MKIGCALDDFIQRTKWIDDEATGSDLYSSEYRNRIYQATALLRVVATELEHAWADAVRAKAEGK